ncbi:MAG: hypothetical protein ABI680_00350 [Chthoniobacteraceae bacterium]
MMNRSSTSVTAVALFIAGALLTPAFAGHTEKEIIAPAEPPPPWEFRIEGYGWTTGLDGRTGVNGFNANVNVGFDEIVKHLDFAAALQLEVRKGRWGVMADGFYAKLGTVGNSPGPLYASGSADLQQVIAEFAVAYRVLEGKAGFIDVYAGGRYNYLGLDIYGSVDRAGVRKVSDEVSDRVVTGITNRAILAAALRDLAPDDISRGDLSRIARSLDRKRIDLANAVAALSSAPPDQIAAAQSRVDKAKKNLSDAINDKLLDALPTHKSADKQWMDPLIGLRGQWNITDRFFFAAQADIGGFGVSSRLTWLAQATFGYNFNKNIYTELGYRYLYTDYNQGGFLYDMTEDGVFLGLGIKF